MKKIRKLLTIYESQMRIEFNENSWNIKIKFMKIKFLKTQIEIFWNENH